MIQATMNKNKWMLLLQVPFLVASLVTSLESTLITSTFETSINETTDKLFQDLESMTEIAASTMSQSHSVDEILTSEVPQPATSSSFDAALVPTSKPEIFAERLLATSMTLFDVAIPYRRNALHANLDVDSSGSKRRQDNVANTNVQIIDDEEVDPADQEEKALRIDANKEKFQAIAADPSGPTPAEKEPSTTAITTHSTETTSIPASTTTPVPATTTPGGLPTGAIIGIVVGVIVVLIIIAAIIVFIYLRKKKADEPDPEAGANPDDGAEEGEDKTAEEIGEDKKEDGENNKKESGEQKDKKAEEEKKESEEDE